MEVQVHFRAHPISPVADLSQESPRVESPIALNESMASLGWPSS